jgi:small conductance mechanosensitive channel
MQTTPADDGASVAEHVDNARTWMQSVVDSSAQLLTQYGFRLLGALIVFTIALVVAAWVRRAVRAALTRAHLEPTMTKFASNMARYAVLVLALLSCAPILGVNITAFAALLGAGGLAIGLASQGALSNGAAGLMLLVTRPFKAGDMIVVDGVTGKVDEIQIFSTTLNTLDNRRIFMPNNSIFGKVIENTTMNPARATTFHAAVAADSDVEKVRATLQSACASCAGVLKDPPPVALIDDFVGGGLRWAITVWADTAKLNVARDQAIAAVQSALRIEKIGGPVPVTTVRLLDQPVLSLAPDGLSVTAPGTSRPAAARPFEAGGPAAKHSDA